MMAGKPLSETNAARARAAWGPDMPRWIEILSIECDKTNQRQVGDHLRLSGSNISRMINKKYNASYDEPEKIVLAAYSADTVDCPVFGSIALKTCIRNRRRTGPALNLLHRQWDRHCPACPQNTDNGDTL